MIELTCKKCDDTTVMCDEGTTAVTCSLCSMIDVVKDMDTGIVGEAQMKPSRAKAVKKRPAKRRDNPLVTKLLNLKPLLLTNNSQSWVVFGKEVDKVLGVAKRERLLTALLQGHTKLTPIDLCEVVEFVPEMIKADRLLTCFDKDQTGVRVVVDEFGGFVGLIDAEAVLSVLAGWWRKAKQ